MSLSAQHKDKLKIALNYKIKDFIEVTRAYYQTDPNMNEIGNQFANSFADDFDMYADETLLDAYIADTQSDINALNNINIGVSTILSNKRSDADLDTAIATLQSAKNQ